jgi:hypothetical protein
VGAQLFHADGQTDMMKLTALFAILQTCLKTNSLSVYHEA